jgi:hypothetical protein
VTGCEHDDVRHYPTELENQWLGGTKCVTCGAWWDEDQQDWGDPA